MATIGHLAAGALCGAVYARATSTKALPAVAAFAAMAAVPDLDFFTAPFAPEGAPLEHRVMTHSLAFAAALGLGGGLALGKRPWKLFTGLLAAVALTSHGILDAMTTNGPGPQLLWPFSASSVAFAWQPIPGTRSYQEYFGSAAIPVVSEEALVFLPVVTAAALVLMAPRWNRSGEAESSKGPPHGTRRPAAEHGAVEFP